MSLPFIDEEGKIKYPDHFKYPSIRYHVFCDVDNKRRLGLVIKENSHTVWVKIMNGAKDSFTIKRHIIKHNVILRKGGNVQHG